MREPTGTPVRASRSAITRPWAPLARAALPLAFVLLLAAAPAAAAPDQDACPALRLAQLHRIVGTDVVRHRLAGAELVERLVRTWRRLPDDRPLLADPDGVVVYDYGGRAPYLLAYLRGPCVVGLLRISRPMLRRALGWLPTVAGGGLALPAERTCAVGAPRWLVEQRYGLTRRQTWQLRASAVVERLAAYWRARTGAALAPRPSAVTVYAVPGEPWVLAYRRRACVLGLLGISHLALRGLVAPSA